MIEAEVAFAAREACLDGPAQLRKFWLERTANT